jgi:hypothetical protein
LLSIFDLRHFPHGSARRSHSSLCREISQRATKKGVAKFVYAQFVPISPRGYYYLLPQDLLHAIFAVFVFALAHIFKAAAEMAEDQAEII